MASNQSNVTPSLLDNLIDLEPDKVQELNYGQSITQYKMAVGRDLENLLNTNQTVLQWPSYLTALDKSILNYGIPDFTPYKVDSPFNREEYCRTLEKVILTFEPRLKEVSVTLLPNKDVNKRVFYFRIKAILMVELLPEPVIFDSTQDSFTGRFQIKNN